MSSSLTSRPGSSPTSSEFDSNDFTDESDFSSSSRTFSSFASVTAVTFLPSLSSSPSAISASSVRISTATVVPLRPITPSTGSFTALLSTSPSPTNTPQASTGSSGGLGQGGIALIASGTLLFVLGLAACMIFFLRRRRNRLSGQSESRKKSFGGEKYADEAQYTPYSGYGKSLSDPGMAPLLRVPSMGQISKIHSESDTESHLYQDGPLSPFTNAGENAPQSNAVILADSTPPRPSQDGQLDTVSLIPAAGASCSVPKLPSLQIPEYRTPPSAVHRQSRSKSPALKTPDVHDPSYDSDDSSSLYSQASASTQRTAKSYATTRQGTIPTLQYPSMPLPSIPQSPSHKPPVSDQAGKPVRELITVTAPRSPPEFNIGQDNREEETSGGLGAEETLFVAKLLQTRQSRVPNTAPTRNASIVSHIERADSIKPALGRGAGSRYKRARRAREAVNSQILTSSPVGPSSPSAYLASDASTLVPSQPSTTTGAAS